MGQLTRRDFLRGRFTRTGAFAQPPHTGSQPACARAVIGTACLAHKQVECRVCGELCQAGAIHFRLQTGRVAAPHLDPHRCNGCGECVAACPAAAIVLHGDGGGGLSMEEETA